ncbi:MAG TPA: major capsid protein, partial [Actinomycetota bacterium]|nr:major capsid protein [Actinomycetota bacterium]
MKNGLFDELPKDLTALSDDELGDQLSRHEKAHELIQAEDAEFIGDRTAEDVLAELRAGALEIMALREEVQARKDAAEAYVAAKAEIAESLTPKAEAEEENGDEGDSDEEGDGDEAEAPSAEATEETVEVEEEKKADPLEAVLVADASNTTSSNTEASTTLNVRMRRGPVPSPAKDRVVVNEPEKKLAFVASGMVPSTERGGVLETPAQIGDALLSTAKAVGVPTHAPGGREERFLVATLDYKDNYPEERVLHAKDVAANSDKIAAIGNPYLGREGVEALVASGGFCAPLEPIYTMPQLATNARPVRDALPNFRAERGGVNVPVPTTIGDAAGAITVITAAEDGLGGTFATKA